MNGEGFQRGNGMDTLSEKGAGRLQHSTSGLQGVFTALRIPQGQQDNPYPSEHPTLEL